MLQFGIWNLVSVCVEKHYVWKHSVRALMSADYTLTEEPHTYRQEYPITYSLRIWD